MDEPQVPVIDWQTVTKNGVTRILPLDWVKIILHLQFLNDFRIRRADIGVLYERAQ